MEDHVCSDKCKYFLNFSDVINFFVFFTIFLLPDYVMQMMARLLANKAKNVN